MSINDEGFLSSDTDSWIRKHRDDYRDEFSIAERLNKLAQHALLHSEPRRDNNHQLLISILFARILCNYQGAIILVERGMVANARALLRVMCEALFALGACVSDENFADALIKDDRHREADLIRSLLSVEKEHSNLTEERRMEFVEREASLRAELKLDNSKRLGPYGIAKHAGMLNQYHLIYAPLSSTVHAAVRDLDTHVNANENGEIVDLRWGPDLPGIDYVLSAAIDSMFTAMGFVEKLFPRSVLSVDLAKLWQERKSKLEPA